MKKKLLISLCVVILTVVIVFFAVDGIRILLGLGKPLDSSFSDSYLEDVKIINESAKCDVIEYGESVNFVDKLNYRKIDKLTEENIFKKGDYDYRFLVINDMSGNLSFSDEDKLMIKKIIDSEKCNFYYIGKKQLKVMNELLPDKVELREDDCSIAWTSKYGKYGSSLGIWTDDDNEHLKNDLYLLGNIMSYHFARMIKTRN